MDSSAAGAPPFDMLLSPYELMNLIHTQQTNPLDRKQFKLQCYALFLRAGTKDAKELEEFIRAKRKKTDHLIKLKNKLLELAELELNDKLSWEQRVQQRILRKTIKEIQHEIDMAGEKKTEFGETIKIASSGLDSTMFDLFDFLAKPAALGLCGNDPHLTEFGNEVNRWYGLLNLCGTYYSILQVLDMNTVTVGRPDWVSEFALEAKSKAEEESAAPGVYIWLVSKQNKETKEEKPFVCFAVKNQSAWNENKVKYGVFAIEDLHSQLMDDFRALETRVKQIHEKEEKCKFELKAPDIKPTLIDDSFHTPAYQIAVINLLKQTGILNDFRSNKDLIQEMMQTHLSFQKFTLERLTSIKCQGELTDSPLLARPWGYEYVGTGMQDKSHT